MKKYEYQILRFLPDRVTGEFVNVGIVFYSRDSRKLEWSFLRNIDRIYHFFPGLDFQYFAGQVEQFALQLQEIRVLIEHEESGDIEASVAGLTNRLMAPDDTSFVFSEVHRGIAPSLEDAFSNLHEKFVLRYNVNHFANAAKILLAANLISQLAQGRSLGSPMLGAGHAFQNQLYGLRAGNASFHPIQASDAYKSLEAPGEQLLNINQAPSSIEQVVMPA
jgi:hypothetical protein